MKFELFLRVDNHSLKIQVPLTVRNRERIHDFISYHETERVVLQMKVNGVDCPINNMKDWTYPEVIRAAYTLSRGIEEEVAFEQKTGATHSIYRHINSLEPIGSKESEQPKFFKIRLQEKYGEDVADDIEKNKVVTQEELIEVLNRHRIDQELHAEQNWMSWHDDAPIEAELVGPMPCR